MQKHLIALSEGTNNPQAEHQALRVLFRKHSLPVLHVQHISDNPQSQFHNKQNPDCLKGVDLNQSPQEPVFQKRLIAPLLEQILKHILRKTDWSSGMLV